MTAPKDALSKDQVIHELAVARSSLEDLELRLHRGGWRGIAAKVYDVRLQLSHRLREAENELGVHLPAPRKDGGTDG